MTTTTPAAVADDKVTKDQSEDVQSQIIDFLFYACSFLNALLPSFYHF
jgi:hypothetical protein